MKRIATENLAKRGDCTKHISAQTKKLFHIFHKWLFHQHSIVEKLIQTFLKWQTNSNGFEHHFIEQRTNSNIFFNIKQTRSCSSIGDRTQTPYFWLQTNKHRTLNLRNLIELSLDLLNQSSN